MFYGWYYKYLYGFLAVVDPDFGYGRIRKKIGWVEIKNLE